MINNLEESPFTTGSRDLLNRVLRICARRILRDARYVDDRHRFSELARIGDRASIEIRLTLSVQRGLFASGITGTDDNRIVMPGAKRIQA